jgi:excisionase family DNA binding protein
MNARTITIKPSERQSLRTAAASLRKSQPEAAAVIDRLVAVSKPRSPSQFVLRQRRAAKRAVVARTEYAKISEIAVAFGVTEQTIRNWADRGWLPCTKTPGGTRRFSRSILASAAALNAPRPATVRDYSEDEIQAIMNAPRRAKQ